MCTWEEREDMCHFSIVGMGETHPYYNAVHRDRLAIFTVCARHVVTTRPDGHEREHETNFGTRSHWRKRVLEVGGGYGGKFESCAQLRATSHKSQES